MNILMINQPLGNRGDEAAHKALVRRLLDRYRDIKIKILFLQQNDDSIEQFKVHDKRIEYINIKPKRGFYKYCYFFLKHGITAFWLFHPTMRGIMQYYKWSDAVLSMPGGICMGGFQVWHHLLFLKIAKITKRPLFYYGRSFGPFPIKTKDNRRFKKISMEMLHYFRYLSIRDKETEKLANSLNLNYVSTVDTAFLESPNVNLPAEISNLLGVRSYMVFVPNELTWHYAYKNRISEDTVYMFYHEVINLIVRKFPNLNIVLLPQLFNQPINDYLFFLKLQRKNPNAPLMVIPDKYSSDIQQTIIKSAKFLIGARYHSIVFSINQDIPFIALSYEHKISGLLEALGKEGTIIDILHGLDSKEAINDTLKKIEISLQNMHNDPFCRGKAIAIANNGFETFCKLLTNK